MLEEIRQLKGEEDGPISIILAGVHGDERCGVEALEKILPNLRIEKGEVLFGYGNPQAIKANKRYIEANLNRMFVEDKSLSLKEKESYEYKRAQFLKTYLDKAETLLDIHASSVKNTKPFVICEANAKGIFEYLPVNIIVSGFDEVEPGGTDYYMNKSGKTGICVECGYLNNPQSTEIAEESIFAFLKVRGHITKDNMVCRRQRYVRMYKKYFAKTDNFILSKTFGDFEEVQKGQLIGIDGGEEVRALKQSVILFAHNGKKVGDEAFLLGEEKESLV